jgi:hypothetical protein
MYAEILTAAFQHGAKTLDAYRAKHRQKLARARVERSVAVREVAIETPLVPFVSLGAWVGQCLCGAGVACHPGWPEARCFACGSVYVAIAWPADRAAIEAALLRRPRMENRNWHQPETVADLLAENIAHGVAGVV